MVRFWRPKVKVTAGRQGGKGIRVSQKAGDHLLEKEAFWHMTDNCTLSILQDMTF